MLKTGTHVVFGVFEFVYRADDNVCPSPKGIAFILCTRTLRHNLFMYNIAHRKKLLEMAAREGKECKTSATGHRCLLWKDEGFCFGVGRLRAKLHTTLSRNTKLTVL